VIRGERRPVYGLRSGVIGRAGYTAGVADCDSRGACVWCLAPGLRGRHFRVQSRYHPNGEVTMKIIYRDQEWELDRRRRVRDVIKEVGLVPQTVLAIRDGKLLTEDVMLDKDDEIKLIAVISGG